MIKVAHQISGSYRGVKAIQMTFKGPVSEVNLSVQISLENFKETTVKIYYGCHLVLIADVRL